ncbi:MAG: tetratricopeptide repeat protein [Hyphomicrobiales bacterium]
MRIFKAFSRVCFIPVLALACLVASPSLAFDGAKPLTQETASPMEAFRFGFKAYREGDKETAVDALQFAASKGSAMAQWKLGRMYALGDGVEASPLRAFEYFRDIANAHADDSPNSPEAPFVANAFVELGGFFKRGIKDTYVGKNPYQARQIYAYAASYFGDPNAQYLLAKMYLEGEGGEKNPRQAGRWLKLAAEKGHVLAQAELGQMLFHSERFLQKRTRGLKWLTIALRRATEVDAEYVRLLHESAFSLASARERKGALRQSNKWLDKNPPLEVEDTKPAIVNVAEPDILEPATNAAAVVVTPLEPLLPVNAEADVVATELEKIQ